MRKRSSEAVKILGAGCMVYAAMAACSAVEQSSDSIGSHTQPSGGGGGLSLSGVVPSNASGGVVPNAMADTNSSGSRLKLQYVEAEDGTRQFLGWYDTKRTEECNFTRMTDGVMRCLPEAASPSTHFSDEGCSIVVAALPKAAVAPKYVFKDGRMLAAGSKYAGEVYDGVPGACTAVTPYLSTFDFYSLGTEVPAGSFVDAVSKTAP